MTSFVSRRGASVPAPVVVERPIGVTIVRWGLFRAGEAEALEVEINGRVACASLIGADGGRRAIAEGAPVLVQRADGLEHVEIEGVASMTLRRSGDAADVLYARTPLLETLGVPGGCVERPELRTR